MDSVDTLNSFAMGNIPLHNLASVLVAASVAGCLEHISRPDDEDDQTYETEAETGTGLPKRVRYTTWALVAIVLVPMVICKITVNSPSSSSELDEHFLDYDFKASVAHASSLQCSRLENSEPTS